jgi:uncharacterized membrane protein YphA (DoxX/SURF4 family)
MSLIELLSYIAVAAVLLTLYIGFVPKAHKSWLMTYTQSFAGILFLFSGWVKAVDPLGTAFKMEDYFAEFYATFSDTALQFIAPVFPFFSGYSTAFAIGMIIFEIVLGIMLLMGDRPKTTAWMFFLLVLFFTVLTGFTYLTGYVPSDQNFFQFSAWGEYKTSNMRVTDCGCFGDFIKLEPKISFFKDVFLLVPAIYFLLAHKQMHQFFTPKSRDLTMVSSIGLLLLYCTYNFYWNEPHVDFRPFKNGTDVAAVRKIEQEAAAAVQVIAMKMRNKATGDIREVPYAEYMKNLSALTEDWETIEQIRTEPAIKPTKISEFGVTDFDDNDMIDTYLSNPEPHLMIPVYKAKYTAVPAVRSVTDSLFVNDTIAVAGFKDSLQVVKRFTEVKQRQEEYYQINWDEDFVDMIKDKIVPLWQAASKDKVGVSVVISGIDAEKAATLAEATGLDVPYYTADEKMLKTMIRSNPGVMLWKNGVMLQKWHIKKLPPWSEIKASFLQ